MSESENIERIDRIINRITFWLAIIIATILVLIAADYMYEQFRYEATNDAQVEQYIDPLVSQASGYVSAVRFQENQEIRKGDTLAIIDGKQSLQLPASKALETVILAAYNGKIGQRLIQPGQYIQLNQTIAYVVDKDQGKWVTANFKETQIRHIHAGQYVEIQTDAFPGEIYDGRVLSISPATGSVFSMLPTDNAAGNFIKSVKRIPVKIVFRERGKSIDQLTAGMNAAVKIIK